MLKELLQLFTLIGFGWYSDAGELFFGNDSRCGQITNFTGELKVGSVAEEKGFKFIRSIHTLEVLRQIDDGRMPYKPGIPR